MNDFFLNPYLGAKPQGCIHSKANGSEFFQSLQAIWIHFVSSLVFLNTTDLVISGHGQRALATN